MSECGVCCGLGWYPIIDRHGKERFQIKCPECFGDGVEPTDDPEIIAEERRAVEQRAKYAEAMAAKNAGHRLQPKERET